MMAADEVVVHPHRRKLSRERLASLVRTVRQHGMSGEGLGLAVAYRTSIGYVLIGGEHRWAALSAPGSKVRAIVLRTWEDLAAWMAVDVTDPRRLGWDPVAAVTFFDKAVLALKPSRTDKPMEDVAEFTGVHRGILENVRFANGLIADPDEDPDLKAFLREILAELERGVDGGHSVRDKVSKFRARKASAGRAPQSVAVQRKALESVTQLEGIIAALADIGPMNPGIPAEDREAYAVRLGSLGAQIAKIKRVLRGGTA